MARRNPTNGIRALDDLSELGRVVVDKRLGQPPRRNERRSVSTL